MYSSLEKLLLLFPDKDWNWNTVSKNTCISWKFVVSNLHLPWVWSSLSSNLNISIETIILNPKYPWSWESISWREDLTLDIVKN